MSCRGCNSNGMVRIGNDIASVYEKCPNGCYDKINSDKDGKLSKSEKQTVNRIVEEQTKDIPTL